MPAGRPSKYSDEYVRAICTRLAEGQSLKTVCSDEAMPNISTVFRWLDDHPEFRDKYTQSKEAGVLAWAEEIIDIADDGSNDWMERNAGDNEYYVLNGEHVQRSKLRIDSRKWLMSKLLPKKYGDKVQQEVTGPDGGPVQVEKIERVIVDPANSDS